MGNDWVCDNIHGKKKVCLYLAGFRLKTQQRTGGHSGTVKRQKMYMNTYEHVQRQTTQNKKQP